MNAERRSRARWPRRLLFAVVALGVVAGALRVVARLSGGPLGPIPGGRLAGPLAADQSPDWSFTDELETIQVEVNPADPLSVTTWVVAHDDALYVTADFINPFKRWPHLALADPRVRLRIGGQLYERRAVRVEDPDEIARLRRAVGEKYGVDPDGLAARVEVWFFRMEPREER